MGLNDVCSALLDWNRRVRIGTGAFAVGAFLIFFTFYVGNAWRKERSLDFPPPLSDQTDYDSIGVQVWKGHGFCRDFGDADFRSQYRKWSRRHAEWADM